MDNVMFQLEAALETTLANKDGEEQNIVKRFRIYFLLIYTLYHLIYFNFNTHGVCFNLIVCSTENHVKYFVT